MPSDRNPSGFWSRRRFGGLLAGTLAVMPLAFAPEARAQADRAQTVVLANAGVINTLDPLRSDYAQTNIIDNAVYDTLVTFDADRKLVGRLATDFKFADDARSVSIKLRSDVKFHDGTPLTAKDVAFTLDRLKKLNIGIASQIEGYESTVVEGDHALTIKLSKPYSLFIGALSKIYIVNSALVTANAGTDDGQAWLQGNGAGSGAYTIAGRSAQDVTLAVHPGYWGKDPARPARIVYRRIDEGATRRDEVKAGNVDLALGMGGRDIDALAGLPGLAVAQLKVALQAEIVFNTRTGPTADPKVRKALRLAYDYAGGLKAIRSDRGSLANGVLPNTMNCRPSLPIVKRDVEAAKKLLAEAGVKDLAIKMSFQPVFDEQKQEATLFQSNAEDIGVKIELVPIAFPNYLASLKNIDSIPSMMLLTDFAQFPDPGVVLVKGYKSDAIGTNRAGFADPEVDRLLDQALASSDADVRCEIYKKVQTILDEKSVMVDMYTITNNVVYRSSMLKEVLVSPVVSPLALVDLRLVKAP